MRQPGQSHRSSEAASLCVLDARGLEPCREHFPSGIMPSTPWTPDGRVRKACQPFSLSCCCHSADLGLLSLPICPPVRSYERRSACPALRSVNGTVLCMPLVAFKPVLPFPLGVPCITAPLVGPLCQFMSTNCPKTCTPRHSSSTTRDHWQAATAPTELPKPPCALLPPPLFPPAVIVGGRLFVSTSDPSVRSCLPLLYLSDPPVIPSAPFTRHILPTPSCFRFDLLSSSV